MNLSIEGVPPHKIHIIWKQYKDLKENDTQASHRKIPMVFY